ncbi:MAG: hypothetical protein AMJ73_00630 [candidate division Zixibacteria bacterium SM1_73]|nr:MAG: hypothetical protein AMJ73_00630 [candidate division Zixibacteria bacterium SM1_73]
MYTDAGKRNQPPTVATPVIVAHHHLKNGPNMIPKKVAFLFIFISLSLRSTIIKQGKQHQFKEPTDIQNRLFCTLSHEVLSKDGSKDYS